MSHGKVLVVDDDPAIRTSLSRALALEGYTVDTAVDGNAALSQVASFAPDVIVLDLMMPNVDGLSVCRVLRSEGNRIPILMLTARTETSDRVAGLDAGADDYLGKPFALEEMLARVRALMRRWKQPGDESAGEILELDDLSIDIASRSVQRAERLIDLSSCSFATRESFSTIRPSTTGSGGTTSGRIRRTLLSTSATSAARSTPRARFP
jgi:two-component system response regulator MprA